MQRDRARFAWTAVLIASTLGGAGCVSYTGGRPGGPGARAQDFYVLVEESEFPAQDAWTTIELAAAHQRSTGDDVVIALLDTGVDLGHPFLIGHFFGTGYDFVDGDADVTEPATGDRAGHGTFMAGLLASVAPGARILPVRVLDADGVADPAVMAAGIRYAVRRGADVINLSAGGLPPDPSVDGALTEARQAGVVIVAAAGNHDANRSEYPASHHGVLAVAATGAGDRKASFSNYGADVDLAAPGVDVVSTVPAGAYGRWSGTSVSAAMVSGAAALVWADAPAADALTVEQVLIESAADLDALNPSYAGQLGGGRLDAAAALLMLRK